MTTGDCTTVTSKGCRVRRVVLLGLILLTLLDTVSGMPYKRSLVRLCSKSLSDALHLACQGRGYNEPFSYSGEDEPLDSLGPGLAEECCNRMCSFSQLEQYCKPTQSSSADAVWVDVSFCFFLWFFSPYIASVRLWLRSAYCMFLPSITFYTYLFPAP